MNRPAHPTTDRPAWVVGMLAPLLLCLITSCVKSGPPKEIENIPRDLTATEQKVVTAGNQFGFSLLTHLNKTRKSENICISPPSASIALAMTMAGADGATYDEMRDTLKFPSTLKREEINEAYRQLLPLLQNIDPAVEVHIANSLWVNEAFPIHPEFVQGSRSYFDARVESVDLTNQKTVEPINKWVEKGTQGKIRKMFESLPPDLAAILLNAIYFKGNWRETFDKAKTREESFATVGGETISVMMMRMPAGKIRFRKSRDLVVGELSYGGDAFVMTILLPAEGKDVNELVASLTAEAWAKRTSGLYASPGMRIGLPKFRLEWEAELNAELKSMGMPSAFELEMANFSRISPDPLLRIHAVVQKTFVDVNEEGTEAAAATAVIMDSPSEPPSFIVNRPFVFAIRERLTNTILFLGKIVKPKSP